MNPIIPLLLLGGGGAAAYFAFRNKAPAIDRGAAMARLADILYRIIGKKGFTPEEPYEAVRLANALGMPLTANGISTGSGMPQNERWPGTDKSVSLFMFEYTKARSPSAPPPPPGSPKYNDESPIPPYEDPRVVRSLALNLEKQGKTIEAKVYHVKADALNKLIRAAKARNQTINTAKGVLASVKSLGSIVRK